MVVMCVVRCRRPLATCTSPRSARSSHRNGSERRLEYRRTQINEAIETYLEASFGIGDVIRQHPQRMLLEGQPGYDQNAPWVTTLSFLRSMSDDYRENLCVLYRRATTIGEMLRGVADQKAGDDVAGIDARLELLRIATANLEENAGYVHDGNEWVRAE